MCFNLMEEEKNMKLIVKRMLSKYEIEFFLLGSVMLLPNLDSLLEHVDWAEASSSLIVILIDLMFIYKVVFCKSSKWAWGAFLLYIFIIAPMIIFIYFTEYIQNDSTINVIYNCLNIFLVAIILLRTCFQLENIKETGGG